MGSSQSGQNWFNEKSELSLRKEMMFGVARPEIFLSSSTADLESPSILSDLGKLTISYVGADIWQNVSVNV